MSQVDGGAPQPTIRERLRMLQTSVYDLLATPLLCERCGAELDADAAREAAPWIPRQRQPVDEPASRTYAPGTKPPVGRRRSQFRTAIRNEEDE